MDTTLQGEPVHLKDFACRICAQMLQVWRRLIYEASSMSPRSSFTRRLISTGTMNARGN
jgi:hypothetical protein